MFSLARPFRFCGWSFAVAFVTSLTINVILLLILAIIYKVTSNRCKSQAATAHSVVWPWELEHHQSFIQYAQQWVQLTDVPQNSTWLPTNFTVSRNHDHRLSHLVIPFHSKQLGELLNNLNTWDILLPCNIAENEDHVPFFPLQVTLIFYINGLPDQELADFLLQRAKQLKGYHCFQNVQAKFAGLTGNDDTYLTGSRLMIEKIISGEIGFEDPHYMFYMEPDCFPIRQNWLNALDSAVRYPNPPFWVRGSLYYGNVNTKVFNVTVRAFDDLLHVNGNGWYNLWDPKFRHWYFFEVRPFIQTYYYGRLCAYDTDLFKLLYFLPAFPFTRHLAHHFQFSQVVKNCWKTKYPVEDILKASKDTVLVHGNQ